jgi:hypothetical protein
MDLILFSTKLCSKLPIDELIENKFLFITKTENGMKLLFNFYIDFAEPQEPIRGILKFEEFLKKYYKNQGTFSTLNLEIRF